VHEGCAGGCTRTNLLCTEVTGDPMTFSPRVYQEVMLYWPADPQSRLCHMGS